MRYLLDTDHISYLQRRSGPEFVAVAARIAAHPPSDLAFSIISFHEQILGAHTYISRAKTTADVVRGYTLLLQIIEGFSFAPILPFDVAAATVFNRLSLQHVKIPTMDMRIASIALSRQMVLVTRNVSDYTRIPGLQLEDWTMVQLH